MALVVNSYFALSYFEEIFLVLKRWRQQSVFTLFLSFSYCLLSLFVCFTRHSTDGTTITIFNLSLSFSYYMLSLFIFAQNFVLVFVLQMKLLLKYILWMHIIYISSNNNTQEGKDFSLNLLFPSLILLTMFEVIHISSSY